MADNCSVFKFLFICCLAWRTQSASAQKINFKAVDQLSKKTVANAKIRGGLFVSETSQTGTVSLYNLRPGDTIRVSLYGYKPNTLIYSSIHPDTIIIYLQPNKELLNEVSITGKRDHQYDSLALRKDYAQVLHTKRPPGKMLSLTRQLTPTYLKIISIRATAQQNLLA